MSQDFYSVLGVSRDASEDEIKKAYRKKAAEYHPDVSDEPDAEEKFKQIKKAKEVLTDEEKRQAYDRMGHEQFEQAEKRGGFEGGAGGAGGGMGGMGGAGGDPFGGGGGGLGDLFEQFFDMGGGGRGPSQGQDLQTRLSISLEDAFHGVEKQVTVERPETCPDCDGEGHPPGVGSDTCPECNGRGQVTRVQRTPMGRIQQQTACPQCEGQGTIYEETCSTCRGEGTVRQESSLQVEIPAGIEDGQTLRMQGEGGAGEPGARSGDLLIEVRVRDHPEFERDGVDLYRNQPVSFPQAVFGDTIQVETLDGKVEVEVPAGTQSGEQFRLRGKGMPRLRRRGQGDLYVVAQVVTPEPGDLDAEEKEALEAFAEAGGEQIDVDQGFFEKLKDRF